MLTQVLYHLNRFSAHRGAQTLWIKRSLWIATELLCNTKGFYVQIPCLRKVF